MPYGIDMQIANTQVLWLQYGYNRSFSLFKFCATANQLHDSQSFARQPINERSMRVEDVGTIMCKIPSVYHWQIFISSEQP